MPICLYANMPVCLYAYMPTCLYTYRPICRLEAASLPGFARDLPRLSTFEIMPMKSKRTCCVNYRRCGRQAKGPNATYCMQCFRVNAVLKGSASSGNATGKGNLGNAGNAAGKGSSQNAGNVKKGKIKKRAGERSGVRRSAKRALIVKKKWLDLILAGWKTWEIRATSTTKRGWIHFAESQAGGKLMGRARLVNCYPVQRKSFKQHFNHHCVPSVDMVPYPTPYAWVLEDAEKFEEPFEYEHKNGAVIWIDV